MENEEALPSDLIFEILTRSPLETVDRCKAVSKCWKQMIYEASFTSLHMKRNRFVFGYIFEQCRHGCEFTQALVSEKGGGGGANWSLDNCRRILASSRQGIVCYERERERKVYRPRYYVCKPATQQWQSLPNPKFRYYTQDVAIVVSKSRPLRYTIVRVSKLRLKWEYKCEVFDSETWVWEETEPPVLPYEDFIDTHKPSVSIGQSVYWTTYRGHMVAFDIDKRRFRYLDMPQSGTQNVVVEYEGGLGVACISEEGSRMEVWVAVGQDECWTRKMSVDMTVALQNMPSYRVVSFCNSDVVFIASSMDGAAFFNFKECSFRRVEVPSSVNDAYKRSPFRSDFERVDLKPLHHSH